MGLLLDAACDACGFSRPGLRLGATHAQIDRHDIEHHDVHAAPCCGDLQSVVVLLGQPPPTPTCERCGRPFVLSPATRYRISTLKGEVLAGHPCPRCAARTLRFTVRDRFV